MAVLVPPLYIPLCSFSVVQLPFHCKYANYLIFPYLSLPPSAPYPPPSFPSFKPSLPSSLLTLLHPYPPSLPSSPYPPPFLPSSLLTSSYSPLPSSLFLLLPFSSACPLLNHSYIYLLPSPTSPLLYTSSPLLYIPPPLSYVYLLPSPIYFSPLLYTPPPLSYIHLLPISYMLLPSSI